MKLIVDDLARDGKHRLSWWFEDDIGGHLGDCDPVDEAALVNLTGEERSDAVMYLTALRTNGVERDSLGFYWPSQTSAQNALRTIKLAVKSDAGGPMPDWAVKAIGAGFKPPKGWKP